MKTNLTLRRADGGLIHGYRFLLWIDGRAFLGNSTKPECRARQYRTRDIPLMVKAGKWEHADIFSPVRVTSGVQLTDRTNNEHGTGRQTGNRREGPMDRE